MTNLTEALAAYENGTPIEPPIADYVGIHDYRALSAKCHLYEMALAEAVAKFDELARLGNAPAFGNSVGNVIARDTLTTLSRVTKAVGA